MDNQIHIVALGQFTRERKGVLFNRYEDWMKIELQLEESPFGEYECVPFRLGEFLNHRSSSSAKASTAVRSLAARPVNRKPWVGKPGTPLGGQAGMSLLPGQEPIWDIDVAEIEEEYEALVLNESLIPTHRETVFTNGQAQARVLGPNVQGDVYLIQLSEHECTVLTDGEFPSKVSVTLS